MSNDVDFMRSIYTEWERGDFDALGWADAEIEFVVADGPEPTRLRGLRAMLQYWREFLRAWDSYNVAVDEYRELGEHRVLVLMRAGSGRAKTSGLELGRHGGRGGGAQVLDIREGAVIRIATYFAREHALSDLGLEK
jgi:ketosteroid isomerase-like protein